MSPKIEDTIPFPRPQHLDPQDFFLFCRAITVNVYKINEVFNEGMSKSEVKTVPFHDDILYALNTRTKRDCTCV